MSSAGLVWLSGCGIGLVSIFIFGFVRQSKRYHAQINRLKTAASSTNDTWVNFSTLENLPPPVKRYFHHVLTDGQPLIKTTWLTQKGTLRTETQSQRWLSFDARHFIAPTAMGFVWKARVSTPLATHIGVIDSYDGGIGAGRVNLFSAIPIAAAANVPELNSGALHRFLAEAVWYPTALLPQAGVRWSPIDDFSARAELTDRGITVSLDFRFNERGEVIAIYSSGRYGRFGGRYQQVPWEGHFQNYQAHAGMRIPNYGEVGWYINQTLQIVWKGTISHVEY